MQNKQYIIVFFILISTFGFGQEQAEKSEKRYVSKTFGGFQLINSQTTEIGPKRSFNLIVEHRFGSTDFSKELIKNFLGTDLVSNIRFALAFPIRERVLLTVGRTRYKKHVDFDGKYTFFKQTTNNSTPFSAAIRVNAAIQMDGFSPIPSNSYFGDGRIFNSYIRYHRLSYTSQLILARKFSNTLSFQIAPAYIHRNLVKGYEKNNIYVIPVGGQIKTGLFNSLIFEFTYILDKPGNVLYPYSFGWQQETASHVFQLFISSSNRILDFSNYSNENQENLMDGRFFFGFNLNKKLWIKK